jgi:small subunit ribosomal protein S13
MNLFGRRLDDNDKVYSSLSKIKGVSASAQGTAVDLCLSIGIGKECTVQDVPSDKWSIITELLSAGSTGGREAAIKRELKRVQRSKVLYRLTPRQTELTVNSTGYSSTSADVQTPASLAVQYKKARKLTQEYVEGKLLKSIKDNVDRLQKTRSYRGLRHLEGLPCRGQRTHTNGGSRRRKGTGSQSTNAKK